MRVDLFDDEIESLRWFSTFTQRSLGDADVVEVSPAAELSAEHRELAEIAALENPDERPDVAELLPVDDFRELLDLVPAHAQVIVAADEDVEPALRDHWEDVCAAFHDTDAHHLYVKPDGILAALDERASVRLSSISGSQPIEIRAQAADFAARSLREAEPELEKLVRSGYTTVVTWPQRGTAERAAYNLGRAQASFEEGDELVFVESSLRDGFVAPQLKLAAFPEHRLIHRRKASTRPARRGRGLLRSFTDLRTGDIVVHEDHGVARFAGFDTKTVSGRHPRLPQPRLPGHRQGVPAGRPAGQDLALRRRRRRAPDAVQARRHALGDDQGPRAPRRAGAGRRAAQPLRRAQAPARPRVRARLGLAARVRERVPLSGDARPARRDRVGQGRHGVRAPDGPADLRRRRLRQDRGRAAGGVQGGQRRQAGADAGADHDPRPAALRHVHRAPARLPVHGRAGLALPAAGRAARRWSSASPRARSTSSSAPTGCSRATCARRTSGC